MMLPLPLPLVTPVSFNAKRRAMCVSNLSVAGVHRPNAKMAAFVFYLNSISLTNLVPEIKIQKNMLPAMRLVRLT